MANITKLEIIMAHLYTRTKGNKPLMSGSEEEAFSEISSLARHPLYKKIKSGLERGESLAVILSSIKGFPRFFIKIIKRGEVTGDLTTAFKIILEHYPVFNRFISHMRTIYTYIAITLIFLLAFLFYFSLIFSESYTAALSNSSFNLPVVFRLFLLISNKYFILFFILAVVAAFAIVHYLLKKDIASLIIKWTPILNRNYLKILSLELATTYHYNLELGLSPNEALADAGEGLRNREISDSLKKIISKVENGNSLSDAIEPNTLLSRLPATAVITLGEAAGRSLELIKEFNGFLRKYLLTNLDREMQTLFKWCVAACGILVGIGVVYVFSAIIHSYSWIGYLQ